jgi:hypothetical protein
MRKMGFAVGAVLVCGLSLMLILPPELSAQWGAIQSGVDAARRAQEAGKPAPATPTPAAPGAAASPEAGASTAPVTYQNKVRPFSYTIPAGWKLIQGEPTGNAERNNISFQKPGTTCVFIIHWTQMVPSFPRKASVDASYKSAMEEKTIGKYLAVKRRDQGGKEGVIGWETIETAEKGSGGFQRIQWQCYDGQNYFYSFMASSEPKDFNANRAELQRIIDSIRFGR